jgi:hypothetical protein
MCMLGGVAGRGVTENVWCVRYILAVASQSLSRVTSYGLIGVMAWCALTYCPFLRPGISARVAS